MAEELSPPRSEEEHRKALFRVFESVGKELFPPPLNPRIIWEIQDLDPSPFSCFHLIVMRANKTTPAQGCLLNLSVLSEEAKGSGGLVGSLFEDLCNRPDFSSKAVDGVVVFREPRVTLWSLREDFKAIISQLPPKACFWLIEPYSSPAHEQIERLRKKGRIDFLRNLGLVEVKSIRIATGLATGLGYSFGRLPAKEKAQSTTPIQPPLELVLEK